MKKRIELGGGLGPAAGRMNPLVTVEVRARSGLYFPIRFCVDTGAETTSLPIPLASRWGVPFSRQVKPASVRGLVGTARSHRDRIHVRLFGEEFSWPCNFIEPSDPSLVYEYGVIGRVGFNLSFDSCLHFPYCLVQRRTGHLPWWQRVRAFFAPWQTVLYNEPL